MNIISQKDIKAIYRVTGTPENFLTALKYLVWGFNLENEHQWKKLLPGDIIFFHSKSSDSFFIKRPPSCIVGFGVVGNNFFEDSTPLWIDEKLSGKKYPFRFGFSEIYLFSNVIISEEWDSTTLEKAEITKQVLLKLIEAAIPLSDLAGFPIMGSYSTIQNPNVRKELLASERKLAFYEGEVAIDEITKSSELKEINKTEEALRYSTSLTVFDDIKERIIKDSGGTYTRNVELLAKAEKAHFNIISKLISLFDGKGYSMRINNHIDLYSFNKTNSFLIEAKSIENRNFKKQSRKGIVQLFEYNYFDIQKYKKEYNLSFSNEVSLLATSDEPRDREYVGFINSLDIKTLAVKGENIIQYGDSFDLNSL